jgi:tripartite-type tricarboxylate transporter receptor subunit TctC
MIWCRFQKGNSISYGIVEGDSVTAVEGDPFTSHRVTANTFPLSDVKLVIVPYRGPPELLTAALRNDVDVIVQSYGALRPAIEDRELRPLASATAIAPPTCRTFRRYGKPASAASR